MLRYGGIAVLAVLAGCGTNGNYRDTDVPMESVAQLDTDAYLGLWYEIARFPNFFEKGCVGVTAEYALRESGKINVKNTCRKERLDGELNVAEGVARVVAPGQLKVKFAEWLPFEGDYWVIGLPEDGQISVVGVPSGDFGWVLARTPQVTPEAQEAALQVLKGAGYDVARLTWTVQ